MSLQLVIGRADVPRAGRAAERDPEQAEHPPGGNSAGAGLLLPASAPGRMLGCGYGIKSFRDLLHRAGDGAGRFGKRSGSCRRETSGCL